MASPIDSNEQRSAADRQWLEQRRQEFQQERDVWQARESRWSWGRLAFFVAAVVPWLAVGGRPWLAGGFTLLAGVLFVVAVRRHHRAQARREAADRLLLVTEESSRRCGGHVTCLRAWQRPANNDEEDRALPPPFERGTVWSLTGQERDDLDLFAAPVGLFGLLNRTSTALGARRLRDMLEHPCLSAETIAARQAMVRWLAQHPQQRLRIMAAMAALRGEDQRLSRLTRAVDRVTPLALPVPVGLLRVWSLLSAAFTALAIGRTAVGDFVWGGWLLALLVVNAVIFLRIRRRVSAALEPWEDVAWAARAYLIAARQAAADLPPETGLAHVRESCAAVVDRRALSRLIRRVGWTDRGGLLYEFLNVLLLADVHVAQAILNCVIPHRAALLAGLSAVAELDALCSLGTFAWEQPVVCYPLPVAAPTVSITDGHHPLVAPERVVPNNAELTAATRMWIVTGSNMAGKSTFLRMVGLNVLLAQIGCPAAACEMRWSPLRLVTDLRARDNLAEEESYFLAEVRHLRRMVLPPAGDTPVLGLIDEPFRGTNSQDQTAASVAVLRHLLTSDNLFLLATHDRHLTALADGGAVKNLHFRENLTSDALVFDYRLHAGPAQTRNALRILEREGYPPELVRHANDWLEDSDPDGP